jgi:chromosome segregation ATPase
MKDIVERLRASVTKGSEPTDADAIDAADEIERLRGDLKGRDAVCDSYADENQRFYDEIERLRGELAQVREILNDRENEITLLRTQNAELLTALHNLYYNDDIEAMDGAYAIIAEHAK